MTIDLHYGRGLVPFEAPQAWSVSLVDHGRPAPGPFEEALLASLKEPEASPPLEAWLEGKKELLLIVSDVTRYTGAERLLPVLKERFLHRVKSVRVLFALGNHRKQTEAEHRGLVSDGVYEAFPCVDHDCFDEGVLASLGKTPSGLDVRLNRLLVEADGAIVTGAVSFHYLAGFGGGRKCIIPGIAAYQTILDTHRRVFHKDRPGKDERAQTGVLQGNPMHEAILEGLGLVKTPLFLINTIFDEEKNLLRIFSGHMKESHEAGCAWYNEHFSAVVPEKADVVVVSAGGFPRDIDFIQSHKALEHAKHAAKDGGTIILLARCEDGVGNPYFLPWFAYPDLAAMEQAVRGADKVYAQTAYSTRLKAERYRIILVSDLDEGQVRRMGMVPKRTLEDALASLDRQKSLLCHVIPEGSKTLVRESKG